MKTKFKQERARVKSADEVLPEYDFSRSRPNKYASRFQGCSAVVVPIQTSRRVPISRDVKAS